MMTLKMPLSCTVLTAWFSRLFTVGLLLAVPPTFWNQLLDILNVPDEIKVLTAPFLGSAVATACEYVILLRKNAPLPTNALYWPLKLFIGWVAGSFGGAGIGGTGVLNASPQNLAFWAGVGGYGAVALYLASQKKEIDEKEKKDDGNG